jgi:hypothetical protein
MDDFMTYGDTFISALIHLEKVLKRCMESNVSLNNEKCAMMLTKGIVLGNHISLVGIWVDPSKIEVILNLPPLETQKEVRIFLGKDGYYRCFMENFAKIACPLFLLLTKDVEFNWTDRCQTFEELKEKLTTTPILRGPDWSFPFHISTDASDTTIGVVLGQQEESCKPYAIYFISKNLTPTELNYTVTKK